MLRLFFPIALVAAAFGLFFIYTNPTYQNIKGLQAQNNSYDDALNKAQELHSVRDKLLGIRNGFSTSDMDKLQRVLPDNVDNIRLVIDINNIASRHNLALTNVDLGDLSASKQNKSSVADSSAAQVGSVIVGFAVSTSNYDDFLAFLQDLEHSLRLVDLTKLSFATGTNNVVTYTMSVRTYWLH